MIPIMSELITKDENKPALSESRFHRVDKRFPDSIKNCFNNKLTALVFYNFK